MGIFDSIKKAVRDNLPEDAINAIEEKIGIDIDGVDNKSKNLNIASTSHVNSVETISFKPVTYSDSYEVANTLFEYDENDNEYTIEQRFLMHNDFKEFSSGAGEIDCSFVLSTSEDASYDSSKPVICIGFSQRDYEVIMGYLNSGNFKHNATITKIENSVAEYKTEFTKDEKYVVAYHFHKGTYKSIYTQMYVEMPIYLKNSIQGNLAIKALEQLVSTYKEVKIEE